MAAGGPVETLAGVSPILIPPNQDLVPATPPLLPIEQDFLGANETTTFAEDHAAVADSYIAQLGLLAAALVPPTINPIYPTNVLGPAVTVPIPPVVEPIVWTPPPVPAPFSGVLNLQQPFPDFTATAPSLIFPNAPTQPNLPVPRSPGIDLNFTYPTVDVVLPAPPNLLSLSTYQFDGVTIPPLSATAPVLTAVAPSPVMYVPNAPYTDALLQELTSTLQERLDIGNTGTNTGLPPLVEQNIWNRAREREIMKAGEAIAALDRMETMGYAFPPGVFLDAQIKIQTELAYVTIGLSRDIAVEQAKLEQENIKTALESTTVIEGKLIDYANQTEQRRFEATRYMTEAMISIYNAQVQAYSAMVNAYRAAIEIYSAQINGQMAIVAAYRAELEAESVKVQMNTALVQQYQVEVNAALASIEVFKGEIQIIQTEAQVEQLKVSIFGQQIAAYTAQINAYTAEVEAYKAKLQAEQTKEAVYATQAEVFSTQVTAVAKEIDAQIAVFKAQLDATIETYEAYKALVAGQTAEVQAIAAANESTARIYSAEVQGSSVYNEAIIKEWQAALDEAIQVTQIGVAAAQANANLYLTTKSIATDAAKVGAQVEAQIAASALGAVTWASHRARQDSVSYGTENNRSNINSTGNSSEIIQSRAFSINNEWADQVSSQTSDSTSTNFNHNIQSVE